MSTTTVAGPNNSTKTTVATWPNGRTTTTIQITANVSGTCKCNSNTRSGQPHCRSFDAAIVCRDCGDLFCGRCTTTHHLPCKECREPFCGHDRGPIEVRCYICYASKGGYSRWVHPTCLEVIENLDGTRTLKWPAAV